MTKRGHTILVAAFLYVQEGGGRALTPLPLSPPSLPLVAQVAASTPDTLTRNTDPPPPRNPYPFASPLPLPTG